MLNLNPQRRIPKPHPIARRRTEHSDILLPACRRVDPYIRRVGLGRMAELAPQDAFHDVVQAAGVDYACHELVPA